jgi:hypothetical protein
MAALAAALDQPDISQHLQVVGHETLLDSHAGHEFAHGVRGAYQMQEHAQSGWVR